MLSTRLSWYLKLTWFFFQIWKSRLDIGIDALVRENVLTWISGNLIWIFKKTWCISIPFDINIWPFDMNIANLIYKCIVDTWNWQSWYFVTFGQAYTGQSYPAFEQLHGCTSLNFVFFILKLSSMFPLETRDKNKKGEWFKNFYQENYFM